MKIYLLALCSCLILGTTIIAQPKISNIELQWNNKKYDQVITMIDQYYVVNKTKRLLKLDLMKVSSFCATGKMNPNPTLCFDYIKTAYKLNGQAKSIINRASSNCTQFNVGDINEYISTSAVANNQLPVVRGKTGLSTRQEGYKWLGDTLKVVKNIPYEQLQQRRLKLTGEHSAKLYFTRLYDSLGLKNFQVKVLDKFVIVYSKISIDPNEFINIESKLNTYYSYYLSNFNMTKCEEYIPVFLAKDVNEVRVFSEKLHGFIYPSYNLGYSSLEDQTIVAIAVTPGKPLLGTVCHELFHILSKNSYESLPAWLEEGMAALFEVSAIQQKKIVGLNNWRKVFLVDPMGRRELSDKLTFTKLEHIVKLDWDEFNASDKDEVPLQSFNYAYSRYLMLYLQDKGDLPRFFNEAASYTFMDIKKSPTEDYIDMILKYAPKSPDFDISFKNWVKTKIQ